MQRNESVWRKNCDWKTRYSKLYSSRRLFRPPEVEPRRISFMSNDVNPYTSLLMRMRATQRDSLIYGCEAARLANPPDVRTLLSTQSEMYNSSMNCARSDDLGGNETLLLDMVRARSRELEDEALDKTLELPQEDVSDELVPLVIPGLKKVDNVQKEDIPRWSIRRSICPVCSQKWKDKSSIDNVKYSGLKRNSSAEFPSVIAPARLRASITAAYVPRPFLAAVDETTGFGGVMRNTGAAWQLTRARRFRNPKPQMPPPEATAPPSSTAPMARKDLDIRVNRFLKDEGMTRYLTS